MSRPAEISKEAHCRRYNTVIEFLGHEIVFQHQQMLVQVSLERFCSEFVEDDH